MVTPGAPDDVEVCPARAPTAAPGRRLTTCHGDQMSINALVGHPAPSDPPSIPRCFARRTTHGRQTSAIAPSGSSSAAAATADPRFLARSTRRMSAPSRRRSATTATSTASAALSSSAATRTRCPSRLLRPPSKCSAISRVRVMLEANGGCTPAPAVSRAILTHNRCPASGSPTASSSTAEHNPPANGGVRYIPPSGGPADTTVTRWIEARANRLLQSEGGALSRLTYARARRPNTTQVYDYVDSYVRDLARHRRHGRDQAVRAPDRCRPAGRRRRRRVGRGRRPVRHQHRNRRPGRRSRLPAYADRPEWTDRGERLVVLRDGGADRARRSVRYRLRRRH